MTKLTFNSSSDNFLTTGFILIKCCSMIVLMIMGCDGHNTPQPEPTPKPDCHSVGDDPNVLMDFEACPTDGLTMICNSYFCNFYEDEMFTSPPVLQGGSFFGDCNVIDCFNAECELFGTGEDVDPIAVFTIDEILGNSNFSGISTIDDSDDFTYVCMPILAN